MKKLLYLLLFAAMLSDCKKDDTALLEQYKRDIVGYWVPFSQTNSNGTFFEDTTYITYSVYKYFSGNGKYYDCSNRFPEIIIDGKQIFDTNVVFIRNYTLSFRDKNIFLITEDAAVKITFIEHDIFDTEYSLFENKWVDRYVRKDWVASMFPIPKD
jgi:hypothetical protein